MDSESLLVIDGHNLEVEKNELHIVNDVRQVYDANLKKSIDSIKCEIKEVPVENGNGDINILYKIPNRNIHITNGIILETIGGENLSISIFKNKERIFCAKTNDNYQLSSKDYGVDIKSSDNNIHYFSDGKSTVLSNLTTNKIVKYASEETIDNHTYTKYYEYFENYNIGIYLLMAEYTPISLITYDYKHKNSSTTINFK